MLAISSVTGWWPPTTRWPAKATFYLLISVTGDLGSALLAAPADPFEYFIAATLALVQVSAESDEVDAAVDAFVSSILTT